MIKNDFIVFDFESTSKNPHSCQPTQIAAAIVNRKDLTVLDKFSSYIQPIFDEEKCKTLNLDPLSEEAIEKTKITRETLEAAPTLKVVWPQFTDFVNKYNYKKSKWDAPIPVGHNLSYDLTIADRICGHEPYKLGPYDEERKTNILFSSVFSFDTMLLWLYWSESLVAVNSVSMDACREYFGMSNEAAHNAVFDVDQTVDLFRRFMKLSREVAKVTKFKGACANGTK